MMRWVLAAVLFLAGLQGRAAAQDTYFIQNDDSFSSLGQWWAQGFTTYGSTNFVLRVAADYKVDAAIVTAAQLTKFQNNAAFTGYATFPSTYGTHAVTLAAGSYYVAIRNRTNGANQYNIELDKKLVVDADTNATYTYNNSPFSGAKYVGKNGGRLWQGFSVVNNLRYFIDGGNSGLNTFFIPASELNNFKAGLSFNYYTDYSGFGDSAKPGFTELNLNPGSYYLAFHNPNPIDKAVTYVMDTWKIVPRSGGSGNSSASIALSGYSSWQTSGTTVKINVDRVTNNRSAGSKSGSLRLRLWAVRAPYYGGTITGYVFGTRALNPLSGGYYYYNITGSVGFTRPPTGTYYTTLTLEEYSSTGWHIIDYLNYDGTVRF